MREPPGHRYRAVPWDTGTRLCQCGKHRGHVIHERNVQVVSEERWRGRNQGARKGYQLQKKKLKAARKAARKAAKSGSCAVTALGVGGAVVAVALGWRGLGG